MKNERGASSILVLVILLLLVFVAVLALVSTGSGYRLSSKNAETVRAYYRMDAEGERILSKVLKISKMSYHNAIDFLEGHQFLNEKQEVISEKMALEIQAEWVKLEQEDEKSEFLERLIPYVFNTVFDDTLSDSLPPENQMKWSTRSNQYVYVNGSIKKLRDSIITKKENNMNNKSSTNDLANGEEHIMTLNIIQEDPQNISAGHIVIDLQLFLHNQEPHLRVLSWQLVHKPFVYRNEIELWKGIVQ